MHDIPYIRPNGRKKYISTIKHQRNANNSHNKWNDVRTERNTFDVADYGNFELEEGKLSWINDDGNMYGFLQGFPSVGINSEQFGFFQNPGNPSLEWHGFPIVPFSKSRYSISKSLFETWVNIGYISEEDIPSIMNKRRI